MQLPFRAVHFAQPREIGSSNHGESSQVLDNVSGSVGKPGEEKHNAKAEHWQWEAADGPGEEDPFKEDWSPALPK